MAVQLIVEVENPVALTLSEQPTLTFNDEVTPGLGMEATI
jgi:hypothetical protein